MSINEEESLSALDQPVKRSTPISYSTFEQPLQRSSSIKKSKISTLQQNNQENEEKRENLRNILKRILEKEKQHQDDNDVSLQPSFTKFECPYFIKCRNRYNDSKKTYEQRFQYEIEQLIAQQATAYEAARLNRHLCITALWPPLHSHSEIDYTQRNFFKLTSKEHKRLNWIMNTNII